MEVTSVIIEEIKDAYSNISYDVLEKIEINKIVQKYLDGVFDSLLKKNEIEVPNTKEELLTIIENKEKILGKNGINFTDEQKEHITNKLIESNAIMIFIKYYLVSLRIV